MELTDAEIRRIAKLANLKIELKEEVKKMRGHFAKMYGLIDVLREVNVEGVAMLIYPHDKYFLRLREDSAKEGISRAPVLDNAPDSLNGYIKAPSPIKEIKQKKGNH